MDTLNYVDLPEADGLAQLFDEVLILLLGRLNLVLQGLLRLRELLHLVLEALDLCIFYSHFVLV